MFMLIEDINLYIDGKVNSVDLSEINMKLNDSVFFAELEKFRNTHKWGNYKNEYKLVKNIEDNHLINIIGHLNELRKFERPYEIIFNYFMIAEFFYRNLKLSELKKFQIPHLDKNGKKVVMSYQGENMFRIEEVS
jgi:uncharacterized protein (UPF0262 family)